MSERLGAYPHRVGIDSIGLCQCRWPLWNEPRKPRLDEIIFCGEPAPVDRPYCEAHTNRAHGRAWVEPTVDDPSEDDILVADDDEAIAA